MIQMPFIEEEKDLIEFSVLDLVADTEPDILLYEPLFVCAWVCTTREKYECKSFI